MSTAFCGVGDVPKGKKRGSMKECAEQGQVRYYGLKKIDIKLVENALMQKKMGKKGNSDSKKEELQLEAVGIGGRIKKVTNLLKSVKDKKEKLALEKELEKLETRREKIRKILRPLEKGKKESKSKKGSKQSRTKAGSKRGSKRRSKRGSKRGSKRESKKGSKK